MKFEDVGSGDGSPNPNEIRIKAGEKVIGVLRGEPMTFKSAFKADQEPRFRFHLNMAVYENGAWKMKILAGGKKLYQQLAELSKAGWNLEQSMTQVSRTGSGIQDTVWTANVLPKAVPQSELDKIARLTLLPLGPGAGNIAPAAHNELPPAEDPLPF